MVRERDWLKKAAFLLAAAFLVLSCIRGIWAVDFWWQLATGRLIAERGIPHTDVFSYPSLGNPWYEMRWLYCLTIYELWTHLGSWAIVLLKTVVVFTTFVLAFFTEFKRERWAFFLAIGVMAVFASSIRFFDRPELWSYLFLALYIWIIQRWRIGGSGLWLIPILQVVWTNTHTLFLIGPGIAFLCLLSVARDPGGRLTALLVFVLTCVACLANPYGIEGIKFPLQLLSQVHGTVFKNNIQELRGPFEAGVTSLEMGFYAALIAIAALGVALRRLRVDLFLALTAAAMLYLSLTGIRNVPLFCISALPLIFVCYRDLELLSRPVLQSALAWTSIFACLFMTWTIATRRWIVWRSDVGAVSFGLAPFRYPVDSVLFMTSNRIPGPVFNTMSEGSYLVWAGYKSYIDPRLEVAGGQHFEESQKIDVDKQAFLTAEEKYGFNSALVDIQSPANEFLLSLPDWNLVHFDSVAAVYIRGGVVMFDHQARSAELFDVMNQERRSRDAMFLPMGVPSPSAKLAQFLLRVGDKVWARRFAELSIDIYPRTRGASAVLGQLAFENNNDGEAIRYLNRAVREAPKNEYLLRALGISYRRFGDTENAVKYLRRAVEVRGSADNWISLADALAIGGDANGAADAYRRGLDQDSKRPASWLKLAALLDLQGKQADAIDVLQKAVEANPSDFSLLSRLATSLDKAGDTGNAKVFAKRTLALNPKDAAMLAIVKKN